MEFRVQGIVKHFLNKKNYFREIEEMLRHRQQACRERQQQRISVLCKT
jgi:hypothetical protein